MAQQTILQYLRLGALPLLIILGGSVGYMILEEWPWSDAVYMTIITLSTVGFGEVGELSRHGRIFTSALILTGVGTFAFVFTAITQAVVAGQVSGAWQKRKLEKKLHQLRDHYIVCGYGRVGATLVERLRTQDRDVIVIDADTENEELITGDNVYFLHGDAVRELTLREAGIERAAGISFCLPSDADNLFGVLSARNLHKYIHIAIRAQNVHSEDKMRFAGANTVVNPTSIAGYSLAMHLIQPNAVNVFEFLAIASTQGYVLESIDIGDSPKFAHKPLGKLKIQGEFGLTILQILRHDKSIVPVVNGTTALAPGDTLLVMGTQDSVSRFCSEM